MTSPAKHDGAAGINQRGGQVMSVVLGALLTMLGTGGFAVTRDAGTLPPAVIGLLLMVIGWIGRRGMTRLLLAMGVGIAAVGMLGTAAYVPAVIRLLGGQTLPHPGRIAVLAVTGVLCFGYVTALVRLAVRKVEQPS